MGWVVHGLLGDYPSPSSRSHNERACLAVVSWAHAQAVMVDPVVVGGVTYERSAIEGWLLERGPVSSTDGLPLASAAVVPDHTLRSLLATMRMQQ